MTWGSFPGSYFSLSLTAAKVVIRVVGGLFVFQVSCSESLVQSYFDSYQNSYCENHFCKTYQLSVNCLMPVRFQGSGIK